MTTEEKLKLLILNRYKSVREFTQEVDIPYTTMDSIFRRGVSNSSVSNIVKICKKLGISADELSEGRITPVNLEPKKEYTEVLEIIDTTKRLLVCSLTLNGKAADKETIDNLITAIDVYMDVAVKKQK